MHAVARFDVFADFGDVRLELGFGIVVVDGGWPGVSVQGAHLCRAGAVDGGNHGIQPRFGSGEAVRIGEVGMADEVDFAAQVVEHGDVEALHVEDVRHAKRVVLRALGEAFFDVADTVVGEIANEAAAERQVNGQRRGADGGVVIGEPGKRVGELAFFDDGTVAADGEVVVADGGDFARGQADHAVTRPAFAAFDGFEQVGVGRARKAVVEGDGGEQVSQDGADDRLVSVVHAVCPLAISWRMVLMTAA